MHFPRLLYRIPSAIYKFIDNIGHLIHCRFKNIPALKCAMATLFNGNLKLKFWPLNICPNLSGKLN
jgi:hypothetical protein